MKRSYLTELGKQGRGRTVNRHRPEAMRFIHDVLLHAASNGLDVYMLCSSLRASVRDEGFREFTGVFFVDCIRDVIVKGADFKILVWNKPIPGLISPKIQEFIESGDASACKGKLEIRVAGTDKNADDVCHFIVATDETRWFVRVEEPHPISPLSDPFEVDSSSIPAAILLDVDDAKVEGAKLLGAFKRLWSAAAPNPRPSINASVLV